MGLERQGGLKGRQTLARKGGDKGLYKWTPFTDDKKVRKRGQTNFYCTATPNSNGEDWIVTYVYELTVENGVQHRYAYVECDYVV